MDDQLTVENYIPQKFVRIHTRAIVICYVTIKPECTSYQELATIYVQIFKACIF